MNVNAEDSMNQFREVTTAAMVEFFTSDNRKASLTHRRVMDIATGEPVRTHLDEDLNSMSGEVTMTEAYDEDGDLHVTFESDQDGRRYTLGYTADGTTMMNVMMKVVLSK